MEMKHYLAKQTKEKLNSLRFHWERDGRTKQIATERNSGRGGGDAHLWFLHTGTVL